MARPPVAYGSIAVYVRLSLRRIQCRDAALFRLMIISLFLPERGTPLFCHFSAAARQVVSAFFLSGCGGAKALSSCITISNLLKNEFVKIKRVLYVGYL